MVKEDLLSIDKTWALSSEEILERFEVDSREGLSSRETKKRLSKFGKNILREKKKKSAWIIFFNQFKSLIIVLLAAAAVLSFAFGELAEGSAIIAVIAVNAAIGFFTEIKAVRSMEALRSLSRVDTRVKRDGSIKTIPAVELVPGDIVVLEGGDIITADLHLVQASKLQADEATLTGESVPVSKATVPVAEDTPLAERSNMLFKGTAVTRGAGEGVVVGTGMNTELGHISALVDEAVEEATPLEKRLDKLGHNLIWITIILAFMIALLGIIRGKEIFLMIETSIALAVAAIPEGLPIVATIALARGMMRMAKKNALINKLASVETLGATSVICTDKTGTLTENKMTVVKLITGDDELNMDEIDETGNKSSHLNQTAREILKIGLLCNNASLTASDEEDQRQSSGEPMEVALLAAGERIGINRNQLVEKMPEEREEAFEAETKMMATYHRQDGKNFLVAVKGAPEPVLKACQNVSVNDNVNELSDSKRQEWLARNEKLAEKGLRILAVAFKEVSSTDDTPYENLTFLGLIGFEDPPRADAPAAIQACRKAGVRIVMITGDQPVTARSIAVSVDLVDDKHLDVIRGSELPRAEMQTEEDEERILNTSIFARVSPRQKLDIIAAHQANQSVVAMTGDGVNDAPALKKADIGIAMGRRGTQVAKEAADMVLKDDAFPTIVAAVEQGRVIFNNIRKFVLYLLSCNVSEILAVGAASVANLPLPILPLQILYLNLVTDVFPAMALGVGEGDKNIMNYPPRSSREAIMLKTHWFLVGGYGLLIAAAVLVAFLLALSGLGVDPEKAVTISFLTLALAQLWHVFNMPDYKSGILSNEVTRNRYVWGALLLCLGLLLIAVYLPGLSHILGLAHPGPSGWMIILGMSLVPLLLGQMAKIIYIRIFAE